MTRIDITFFPMLRLSSNLHCILPATSVIIVHHQHYPALMQTDVLIEKRAYVTFSTLSTFHSTHQFTCFTTWTTTHLSTHCYPHYYSRTLTSLSVQRSSFPYWKPWNLSCFWLFHQLSFKIVNTTSNSFVTASNTFFHQQTSYASIIHRNHSPWKSSFFGEKMTSSQPLTLNHELEALCLLCTQLRLYCIIATAYTCYASKSTKITCFTVTYKSFKR